VVRVEAMQRRLQCLRHQAPRPTDGGSNEPELIRSAFALLNIYQLNFATVRPHLERSTAHYAQSSQAFAGSPWAIVFYRIL